MGIAFSTNTLQELINETNTAINNNTQNIDYNVQQNCFVFSSQNVSIGCTGGQTVISGSTVKVVEEDQQVCTFTSSQAAKLTTQNATNFTNASNEQVSQINKLLQEAGSFSAANSTNQTNIVNNLLNNNFVNNIQNILSDCVQNLVTVQDQDIFICNATIKDSVLLFDKSYKGNLTGQCMANNLFNSNNFSKATNNVITNITQFNDTKQKGSLGAIIAIIILIVLLFIAGPISGTKTVQNNSTTKTVFTGIIIFLVVCLIIAIGIFLYYFFYPPQYSITPIKITPQNDTICLQFVSNDTNFPTNRPNPSNDPNDGTFYTISIPDGTYGDGNTLAMAIENAVNAHMYSNGDKLTKFWDGVTNSTVDKTSTQQLRVTFDDDAKTFEFTTVAGNKEPNLGFDLKFFSCPNSILPSIDPSKTINFTTQYSNTGTKAFTSAVPYTNPTNLWKIFGIGLGVIALIGIAIGIYFLIRKRTVSTSVSK